MAEKGRFKVTDADRKYNTEAWRRYMMGNPAYTKASANGKKSPRDKIAPSANA